MAKQYQFRRGTETQHQTFTGAEGELSIETTNDVLHLHDGSTVGGIPLLKSDLSNIVDGSLKIEQLGSGDPNSYIIYDSSGEPNFEQELDGSFIVSGTIPTSALEAGTPNTFVAISGGGVIFKPQLSGETDFEEESVTNNKIQDLSISGTQIVDWTVVTDSIDDGAVTGPKLQDPSVTTDKIANNAVLSAMFRSDSITEEKIANETFTTSNFSNGSITGAKLVDSTISASRFDQTTAGNSLGKKILDNSAPPSPTVGNEGDIWYVLTDPVTEDIIVSFDKEEYNEGETGTIKIAAIAGGTIGGTVSYTITGIQTGDIDIPLSGNFTLDSNLEDTITFTLTEDLSTSEGDETMVITVTNGLSPASAVVRDTSTGIFQATITISSNTNNFDARQAIIGAGWDGVQRMNAEIIINSGVVVGSNAVTGPSFTVDNIPLGSTVNIVNNGTIAGKGGQGAFRGHQNGGKPGQAGGIGISVTPSVNGEVILTNNGIIGGGGGGGGSGTGGDTCASECSFFGGHGGGGAGFGAGRDEIENTSLTNGDCDIAASQPGTLLDGGSGSAGCTRAGGTGGNGGDGGDLGQPGQPGSLGSPSAFSTRGTPGAGGAAGLAITGTSRIIISQTGDIRGNTSTV